MFFFILPSLLWCLRDHGVSGVNTERLSVHEGERITLHTGVKTDPQKKLMWYFTLVDDIPIAEITGDLSKSCTDVQCKNSDGRFRKRLKLDPQTGSLTITETRTSDSGVYKLKIDSSRLSAKIFIVAVHSFFSVDTDEESAFVIEGDSVSLHTGVTTNQQEKIKWYFDDTRIAQINRDLSVICTDVQCNDGTERFRDRLKLDHQTGSLTITNIMSTDSRVYQLRITSRNSSSTKSFIVAVYDFPDVKVDEIKKKSVKEGESVTLDTHVIKTPNDLMTWYVNDILIAEITGDPNKTCTDDQCDERFRDRLKLDHQTGSLTITNTTNTDSGVYKLQINSSRISIMRIFSVSVSIKSSDVNVTGSGPSSAVTGICVFLVLLVAAAVTALIYRRRRTSKQAGQYDATEQNNHESNGVGDSMP